MFSLTLRDLRSLFLRQILGVKGAAFDVPFAADSQCGFESGVLRGFGGGEGVGVAVFEGFAGAVGRGPGVAVFFVRHCFQEFGAEGRDLGVDFGFGDRVLFELFAEGEAFYFDGAFGFVF